MSRAASSSVVVPLDGSALAEQALWVAARLAHGLRATLHLVAVYAPSHGETDGPGQAVTGREIRQDLQEYLAEKAEELGTALGVACACAVLNGWPPSALAEYVRANRAALLVMTAHGQSGVSRSWIGSVTVGVLTLSRVPVLVLRPDLPPPERFDRILVALDGSAGSEKVLKEAVALGALQGEPEYTLVEILEPLTPLLHPVAARDAGDPEVACARRRETVASNLAREAARLKEHGGAVTTRVLVADQVAKSLILLADSLDSDLVVVGRQSARARRGVRLGSVADKVVRGTRSPVLVVPLGTGRPLAGRGSAQRRRATTKAGA